MKNLFLFSFRGHDIDTEDIRVVGGNLDISDSGFSTYIGDVKKTIIHEHFNINTRHFDIGIIHVREPYPLQA